MVGYLEVLLDYCRRFYNRQFLTRKVENTDLLRKFDRLLRDYFDEGRQLSSGIPTVQYCADKLCLSPKYLSSLVKHICGYTVQELVFKAITRRAIFLLTATGRPIQDIAVEMGFPNVSAFGTFFKKQTGLSPRRYREGERSV